MFEMFVEITEDTPKAIYAKVEYILRYDKEKKDFTCTCAGNGAYRKSCWHIKQFRKKLGIK